MSKIYRIKHVIVGVRQGTYFERKSDHGGYVSWEDNRTTFSSEVVEQNPNLFQRVIGIHVNGEDVDILGDEPMSYERILSCIGLHPKNMRTVTYHRGTKEKPQGSLTPGESVPICDDMVFNVSITDNA